MNKYKGMIAIAALFFAGAANAAAVSDLTAEWGASLKGIRSVFVVGSSIAGLGLLAAGGLQLKKHGENPQQVPLSRPIIFLTAGALLFGLGATSNTLQETLLGENAEAGSANLEDDFSDFN